MGTTGMEMAGGAALAEGFGGAGILGESAAWGLGEGLGAEALAGGLAGAGEVTAPSWFSSAMPEIGGGLESFMSAGLPTLPEASMIPQVGMTIPGAVAPVAEASMLSGPFTEVAGSPWESLKTGVESAYNIGSRGLDTFNASPIGKAVNTVQKVGGLANMGSQYMDRQRALDQMDKQLENYRSSGNQSAPSGGLSQLGSTTPFGSRNFRMN